MRKEKRLRKLSTSLEKRIENLLKKGEINQQLFDFIREFPEKERRIQFWEKLLSRKDLTPTNLYLISQKIKEESDELNKKVRQKYAKTASDDDLITTLRIEDTTFQEIIWSELYQRIQMYLKKHRTKEQAKKILKEVFKNIEKYRDKAWQILGLLGLSDDELQDLRNLSFMYSRPDLQTQIQNLIKERRGFWKRKDYNVTAIPEIRRIMEEIAKLKKEQE